MPTIEVILLETYTFVIETKQLYNGRNRKYYNSRYSSRSGDGRIQWLSCTRPLSVRNLPIEVQWRGARATCGDLMIVRKGKLVEKIQPSEDFRVKVIYIASGFVVLSTPQNNYGMKGQLSLFLNPIMSLTTEQQELCLRDFEQVEYRLRNTDHHFHRDMLIASTQMLILDFFDFHSHLYGEDNISVQNASIMSRFLNMLENGTSASIVK